MTKVHTIVCGSCSAGSHRQAEPPLQLRLWGPRANLRLRISDVSSAMTRPVSSVFLDLLDIATFVYCADQAVSRGGAGVDNAGANWRRRLVFHIAVRNPDFWMSKPVRDALIANLSFLSEDEYEFEFHHEPHARPIQKYFELDDSSVEGDADEVVMFSGGIDSLAGAVQEAVVGGRKLVLVNHRPTPKVKGRHGALLRAFRERCPQNPPIHLAVRVNKKKRLNREYTQRTRSFLYAALGTTVASMLGLHRLRFYENGVLSLNLPISEQVVGARASRTTHPKVLHGFSQLFSLLAGQSFVVENPFIGRTKTEVVKLIADAGCEDLIRLSTSCMHTWSSTKQHPHCGACSQCIDRRFATLAAGQEANDPRDGYEIDLFTGARPEAEPRTLLASYVDMVNRIEDMTVTTMLGQFGELARALPYLHDQVDVAAQKVLDLLQRHARAVSGVIQLGLKQHAAEILKHSLSPNCLLGLVCDFGTREDQRSPQDGGGIVPPTNSWSLRPDGFWEIQFDGGRPVVFPNRIGFQYLFELIQHPGARYRAQDLDDIIRTPGVARRTEVFEPEELVRFVAQFGADEQLDKLGREDLARAIEFLDSAIQTAEAERTPEGVENADALRSKRERIKKHLQKAFNLHGQPRLLGDERDKVRNRVCNSIRYALNLVESFHDQLYKHLRPPVLKLGHILSYNPPPDLQWRTFTVATTPRLNAV